MRKKLVEIIQNDLDRRVIIKKDYVAGVFAEKVFDKKVPNYYCASFQIEDGVLTIFAGDWNIDGATLSPDKIGKLDIARGYIPHDLGYIEMHNMAADEDWKEAGWTEDEIRRLWDIVLGVSIEKEAEMLGGAWQKGGNIVARIYYNAVRVFGGLYHKIARVFSVVLVFLLLTGFIGGCAIPDGVFEPSDDPIEYEVIDNSDRGDNATGN